MYQYYCVVIAHRWSYCYHIFVVGVAFVGTSVIVGMVLFAQQSTITKTLTILSYIFGSMLVLSSAEIRYLVPIRLFKNIQCSAAASVRLSEIVNATLDS